MALANTEALLGLLCPPFDRALATQLINEFVEMERRYIQRDWGPSEVDGGKFSEAVARILYHQDSGNLNSARGFSDCLDYLFNDQVPHKIAPRSDAKHIALALKSIYKFRSDRGAAHLSKTYTPNQMDARFVLENSRWVMNELLRVFAPGDREVIAKTVRELLRFEVPAIGQFDSILLVQRTDLSPAEELLLLLHFGGDAGVTRKELGQYALCSSSSVTESLQYLQSRDVRQVIQLPNQRYCLTDLGAKRVREALADKLLAE